MVRASGYSTKVRIVGVDVGRRRIGLAVSDASATLAIPWQASEGKGAPGQVAIRIADAVRALGDEDGVVTELVVGLPVHLDGRPHEAAERTRTIAGLVGRRLRLPVTLQDERLTSVEAESRLAEREGDWRRRKARLDAAAAAVILQEYLDVRSQESGDRDRRETRRGQETGEA